MEPTIPIRMTVPDPSPAPIPVGSAPQFAGNKIPSAYGSSVSCGTGLTCPVSGQRKLFMKYMGLWPAPNRSPATNSDHWNNRYDKNQCDLAD